MNKRFLNLEEVSKMLGVTVHTLYSWTHQKYIPHFKIGGLLKFDKQEILNWIEERRVKVNEDL